MKNIHAAVVAAMLGVLVSGTVCADQWYITHDPVSPADFAQEQEVSNNMYSQTNQCLNTFGSKRVADLKKQFRGKMFVTFLDAKSGVSRMTSTSLEESKKTMAVAEKGGLELVVYGGHIQKHPRINSLFQYDTDGWRAIFVPALAVNQYWFCGIFLHELFHASEDRRRRAEMRPPDAYLGPAWIDEELSAHDLEREVLNAYTGGQYISAITAYVEKELDNGLEGIWANARRQGFPSIEVLFTPASPEEERVRRGQILLDATLLFIEKKGGGIDEKRKEFRRMIEEHFRRF